MTNEQINKIRDISRLKLIFTIDSIKPLTIRLFTERGFNKIERIMRLQCESVDDNLKEARDKWLNPKLVAYYKKAVKKVKIKNKRK